MSESAVCELATSPSVFDLVVGLAFYVMVFSAVAVAVCGSLMLVSPRLREEILNDLRWWRDHGFRRAGVPQDLADAGPPGAQPSPC